MLNGIDDRNIKKQPDIHIRLFFMSLVWEYISDIGQRKAILD